MDRYAGINIIVRKSNARTIIILVVKPTFALKLININSVIQHTQDKYYMGLEHYYFF